MRRIAVTITLSALAAALAAGCVPSSEVPPVSGIPPTSPASTGTQLTSNPQALTVSVSATVPPYPSVTVSQSGASTAPYLIQSQSTCLANGYMQLVTTTPSGSAATFELLGLHTGQCVLDFGGANGAALIVPVTLTP